MRGSITRLWEDGCGFILAEDGCEVYFDQFGRKKNGIHDLRVGYWVEFELQNGFAQLRAMNIKRLTSDVSEHPRSKGVG